MYSTLPHPHLVWMDLWQYSSGLPVVLAGPFAPLFACVLDPMEWTNLLNAYAMLPTTMANNLARPTDPE
jgi:hypothetical protein